jgi:hypothetical protein
MNPEPLAAIGFDVRWSSQKIFLAARLLPNLLRIATTAILTRLLYPVHAVFTRSTCQSFFPHDRRFRVAWPQRSLNGAADEHSERFLGTAIFRFWARR